MTARTWPLGRYATAVAVAILFSCSPAVIVGAATNPLAAVMHKLALNPAAPKEYTASVQLRLHMRYFPWITKTVSGSEFYQHPGFYRFVFRDAPKSLDQLSTLEDDLANPATWAQRNDVSLLVAPAPGVDPVVRLMPKAHKLVKTLDITVDMAKGHIAKAFWTRYDGGTITMIQKYGTVRNHEVVAEQDAAIRIPSMSADVVATYSNFELDTGVTH